MSKILLLLSSLVIVTLPWGASLSPAKAGDGHTMACAEQGLGWHFYCDPLEENIEPDPPLAVTTPTVAPPKTGLKTKPKASKAPKTPRVQLEAIGERLEVLKARAIMDPTTENIRDYIAYQSEQLERASLFSDQWRRTIWQNPELDYSQFRPTGTMAKRAWLDERKERVTITLKELSQRYGVFYFYKGMDCTPCRASAPIMRAFMDKYTITAMAVSMDGHTYPEFGEFVTDAGQAQQLGITADFLPAVALFDTRTREVVEIGYGVMAIDELEDRIFALTQLKPGEDY